jgi:hypothetical protein
MVTTKERARPLTLHFKLHKCKETVSSVEGLVRQAADSEVTEEACVDRSMSTRKKRRTE